MSPIKESSSSCAKEFTPASVPVTRRSKTMPIDSPGAKFLYTILKQLDLKGIDWSLVASQLDISNGHAARMRYHRFRNQMEGINPQQRKKQTNRVSKPSTNSSKAGHKKIVSSPESSPKIKTEPLNDSAYESNNNHPYIKSERPFAQDMPRLNDIPTYGSSSSMICAPASAAYSHPSAFSVPMAPPYHQMNIAPELRTYSTSPPYPPVPTLETGYRSPVAWTPIKTEPRALSETHKSTETVETPLKEEVDLAGVGAALGYKNVQSVGNRFRQMRQKFGFPSLECTAGSSPARKKTAAKGKDVNGEDNGDDEAVTPTPSPVKRGAASASKKSRKGAKVSTEKPIPATAPVVKDEEGSSDEEKEIPKANFVVESTFVVP
ncbi:hypothetical protein BDV18DRAFT_163736 [Aspergillus unguis]